MPLGKKDAPELMRKRGSMAWQKIKEKFKASEKKLESKQQLRTKTLARRDKLTEEEQKGRSHRIAVRVLKLKQIKEAKTVFLYASYQSEVQTDALIQELLKAGKQVALPKVQGKDMVFYQIYSLAELQWGAHNIREPYGWEGTQLIPEKKDVMLLPGTVFDRTGNRIGYGGGYYDRYLAALEEEHQPCLMGLAYSLQIRQHKLPVNEQDKPVQFIVTDKEMIDTKKEKGNTSHGVGWILEAVEAVIEIVVDLVTDAV